MSSCDRDLTRTLRKEVEIGDVVSICGLRCFKYRKSAPERERARENVIIDEKQKKRVDDYLNDLPSQIFIMSSEEHIRSCKL